METDDQILCEHYGRMLGLTDGWKVEGVDLSLQERELKLRLAWGNEGAVCPECGKSLPRHDLSPERKWRHLEGRRGQSLGVDFKTESVFQQADKLKAFSGGDWGQSKILARNLIFTIQAPVSNGPSINSVVLGVRN